MSVDSTIVNVAAGELDIIISEKEDFFTRPMPRDVVSLWNGSGAQVKSAPNQWIVMDDLTPLDLHLDATIIYGRFTSWSLPSGLPSRDARKGHEVDLVLDVSRRRKVPHGSLQRLVPHPVLNRTYIEAKPQHSRCVCGSEGFEIEFRRVEPTTLSDGFAFQEHVLFTITCRRRKNKTTAILAWMAIE